MEEHREALDVKYRNEGRGLLAFFYGDPLEENEENERLDYKKEYERILEIMKTSKRKIRFRSEPATVKKVRDRLHFGCEVLHFTGHGGDSSLRFEDEMKCGMAKPMKDDDLACLFRQRGNSLKLVVFGACKSEECGLAVAKAGVPHVVAIRCAVSDQVAQDFVVRFYEALITGKITVKKAFDIAVISVQARIEAARFLLLPEGANHEVIMFNDLPDHIDETPRLSRYFRLPPARRAYIGGNKLREVLSMLENDNTGCVTIIGKRGIGKTERALQACHYMGERGYFDAIFFAQCRDAVAYQRSIQNPRGQQARVQRLCQLVGVALDLSQDVRSPEDLWMSLRKSAEDKMRCDPPAKVLLVLDAVNALIEDDGRREARKSLADFVDQLCSTRPHLKLLVTSENSLQEMTGRHLRKCTEQVCG